MKKIKTIFSLSITLAIMAISCGKLKGNQAEKEEDLANINMVERGEYLVTTIGCHDCHSPKIMTEHGPGLDPDRLLSGYPAGVPLPKFDKKTSGNYVLFSPMLMAAVGPWGVSFPGNLTADSTGIGTWTLEQFSKAIREGKYKGADGTRMLLPPMPWENYKHLTDEDVQAIFSYLKSTRPVHNIVPAAISPAEINTLLYK